MAPTFGHPSGKVSNCLAGNDLFTVRITCFVDSLLKRVLFSVIKQARTTKETMIGQRTFYDDGFMFKNDKC